MDYLPISYKVQYLPVWFVVRTRKLKILKIKSCDVYASEQERPKTNQLKGGTKVQAF